MRLEERTKQLKDMTDEELVAELQRIRQQRIAKIKADRKAKPKTSIHQKVDVDVEDLLI